MQTDPVLLFQIWRETDARLDQLAARVREGCEVLAASDFARWLTFSGVLRLLQANETQGALPVKGAELRKKAEDLIYECGVRLTKQHGNRQPDPLVPRSELEKINRALANITQRLDSISPPLTEKTPEVGKPAEPALRVIHGGA